MQAQVLAVSRRLGLTTRDGAKEAVLTASRDYRAPIAEVWDAISNPERIPRWFLPIEGDLRIGGRYQLIGNAGGTIQRCEPPRQLTVTWEFGGQVTLVEVTLSGGEGDDEPGTTLELVHTATIDDQMWPQFGPGAVGIGWDMVLLGLGLHVETGTSMTPAEAAEWTASPEGVRFMTASNELWQQASVEAGTDPEEAAAAAARCLAAYKGEVVDPGDAG